MKKARESSISVAKIIICIYGEKDWDQEDVMSVWAGESQSRVTRGTGAIDFMSALKQSLEIVF